MNFYTTIFFIFLSILIIILVLFYYLLKSKNSSLTSKYFDCPDYWTVDMSTSNCIVPSLNSNLNAKYSNVYGNIRSTGIYNGVGYYGIPENTISNDGTKVDFNNSSWYSNYNTTSLQCAWQKWANYNNIEWTGITNVSIPNC